MKCIDCQKASSEDRNGDVSVHVRAGTWLTGALFLCDTCYASLLATGYKKQAKPVFMAAYNEEPKQAKTAEALYDEHIQPLMERIAKIAEEHSIPFIAAFQRNEDFMRTFSHLPDGTISELREAGYAIGVYHRRY